MIKVLSIFKFINVYFSVEVGILLFIEFGYRYSTLAAENVKLFLNVFQNDMGDVLNSFLGIMVPTSGMVG
jgi:hypothetical protein